MKQEYGVTIPDYGEIYDVEELPVKVGKLKTKRPVTLRNEILSRLDKLQSQIDDMKQSVKEDVGNKDLKDEDMFRIKEKMKDLEQNILRIIEG